MKNRTLLLVSGLALALPQAQAQAASSASPDATTLTVFAAGSLHGALQAVEQQYKALNGTRFKTVYGPAGSLKERIENGARPDVFLSANLAHPQRLAEQGKALPAVIFARNQLCVVGRPGLGLSQDNLLDKLLDPALKVGTSTPRSDPGGDYAWQLFARAEQVRSGAYATLSQKARQLVGGPNSPAVPPGRNAVQYFFAQHQADMFIGYCSSQKPGGNADPAKVQAPAALEVIADYGLAVLKGAPQQQAAASRFALYLLTPEAQARFAAYGFQPIGTPQKYLPLPGARNP